jgi:hypothetical protein
MAENIIIPEQIYLGFRQDTDAKVGFGTYYEDNAGCRKRQSTVDSWVKNGVAATNYHNRNYNQEEGSQFVEAKLVPASLVGNKAASGFKLSRKVTHGGGWNDLNVYWRIVDPRGFELEISSGNLAKLFQYCTIDHGNISEDCVWGWDKGNGSKVVLLPVNSEIYLQSVKTTEIHNTVPKSLKEIPLGSSVVLKNGYEGVIYGEMFEVRMNEYGKCTVSETYVIKLHKLMGEKPHLFLVKSPKIASFTPPTESLSVAECLDIVNRLVDDGDASTSTAGKTPDGRVTLFSDDPAIIERLCLKYAPIPKSEYVDLIRKASQDINPHAEATTDVEIICQVNANLENVRYNCKDIYVGANEAGKIFTIFQLRSLPSHQGGQGLIIHEHTNGQYKSVVNGNHQVFKFNAGISDNLYFSAEVLGKFTNHVTGMDYSFAEKRYGSRTYIHLGPKTECVNLSTLTRIWKVTMMLDNNKEYSINRR